MGRWTREVEDTIIKGIESGLTNKDSCILAGVTEDAFYSRVRRGARELDRMEAASLSRPDPKEQDYVSFALRVGQADPKRKKKLVDRLIEIANGVSQRTVKRTYRTDRDGEQYLYEEIVTEKDVPPNPQPIEWYLERKYPNEFGRVSRIEVHDWRKEIRLQLDRGEVTPVEVWEAIGDEEIAAEFLESAGYPLPKLIDVTSTVETEEGKFGTEDIAGSSAGSEDGEGPEGNREE